MARSFDACSYCLESSSDFDASCMDFSEPKSDKYGSRVTIRYRYRKGGGKYSDPLPLRIKSPDIKCTGIWTKGKDGTADPYACLSMHDSRFEPSDEQLDFIRLVQEIDASIVKHFSQNEVRRKIGYKGDVKDYTRLVQGLKSLLFKCDEDSGNVIAGEPPTMFARLAIRYDPTRTKENRDSVPAVITTAFTELDKFTGNFDVIDSSEILEQFSEQPFMMTCILSLHSVYVNLKISTQYRLMSCAVLQRLQKKASFVPITSVSNNMKRKYESASSTNDFDDDMAQ